MIIADSELYSTFANELLGEYSETLTTYWLLVLVLLIMWLE